MDKKLLLIDGHSILNRAFYGIPLLTNSEGIHTNAAYGFLNILFKILDEEKPDYLTVAFDVHAPTFRHKKYADYKGTRHKMPDELTEQVPVIQDILKAMGIHLAFMEGYEADDILGTLSRRADEKEVRSVILSGDRDLLQLATDTIEIRIPKTIRGETVVEDYYAKDVEDAYGVTPAEFIDLKALMGDSSDNIPGVPGIGVKTATKIIGQYHSIENAFAHAEEIKPARAGNALREHYDMAVMSKDLARIRLDAPVNFIPEECERSDFYTPEAYRLFKKYDFRNFLTRFQGEQNSGIPEVRILSGTDEARKFLEGLKGAERIGFALQAAEQMPADAGQSGPDSGKDTGSGIIGYAFASEPDQAVYIPADAAGPEQVETLLRDIPEINVYGLKEILKHFPFAENGRFFDIEIGEYLLDPLNNGYPYDVIASRHAHLTVPAGEEIFGQKKLPKPEQMEPEKAAEYYGLMAFTALSVRGPMEEELESTGMLRLFREIEMPLVYTLSAMEKAGMKVHREELTEFGDQLQEQIQVLEKRIYEEAGETFNINSPKQLGVILFEKMGLPGGKKTKTGYSTAAGVLEKLAPYEPVVQDILEYRQLTKLKSTYADALPGYIREDGRIHSNFNQTITATGRISSSEPNLQNIPIRMELGRQIRKVFVPEDGCVYIDADYSQIELRVLAALSGDEKLIDAYRQAKDIHRITASQVFHVPFEEVTPLQRRNAKAVNFGIIYGISSFGLSQGLSISRKEAEEYIGRYFATYPTIKRYLDHLVESARENGYAVTYFGRRRPVPEIKSSNFMKRSFEERVAMNSPIQGTAADIIKIAMNRVRKRLSEEGYRSRLVLQVHDELLIEAPESEADAVQSILVEEMRGAADLPVALEVDVHRGKSWYEAK